MTATLSHRSTMVEPDDVRVPECARAMFSAIQWGMGGEWAGALTYAMGRAIVGKDCLEGGLVESVALRLALPDGRRAVAIWHAVGRTECGECHKPLKPTASGLLAAHEGANYEPCAGSGEYPEQGTGECSACGATPRTLKSGAAAKHRPANYEPCAGSGREVGYADAVPGETPWTWSCGYVSEPSGWWSTGAPQKVTEAAFRKLLAG